MINRVIIEVVKEVEIISNMNDYDIECPEEDYLEFIKILKMSNGYELFSKSISFVCDNCGSFIIPTRVIYESIEKAMDYIDNDDFCQKNELYGNLYDNLWGIERALREPVHLTNEEWNEFSIHGKKNLGIIYDENGNEITDDEGNPLRYVKEETSIILDPDCRCRGIIR